MKHLHQKSIHGNPLINVKQNAQVNYWCQVLDSTPDELKNAVNRAGNSPDKVRAYLDRDLNIRL